MAIFLLKPQESYCNSIDDHCPMLLQARFLKIHSATLVQNRIIAIVVVKKFSPPIKYPIMEKDAAFICSLCFSSVNVCPILIIIPPPTTVPAVSKAQTPIMILKRAGLLFSELVQHMKGPPMQKPRSKKLAAPPVQYAAQFALP